MDTDPRQDGHAERGSSPLHRLSKPLVGVSHRTRPRKIARSQLTDLESRRRDQFVDLPIKVAAAPNWLPDRRKSVLPRDDAGVGSTAMLNKSRRPSGLRTRFICARAFGAFGMEHSVHVITMVSML